MKIPFFIGLIQISNKLYEDITVKRIFKSLTFIMQKNISKP